MLNEAIWDRAKIPLAKGGQGRWRGWTDYTTCRAGESTGRVRSLGHPP